jgi:protein-disulfide isomerase
MSHSTERVTPGIGKAFKIASSALVTTAAILVIWTFVDARLTRSAGFRTEDIKGLSIAPETVRHSKGAGSIAVVEFTDYQCPFCAEHARSTVPRIHQELVQNGTVRHVVFNFPLERIHPFARKAGEAAECAARQHHYWEMYTRLFTDTDKVNQQLFTQLGDALGLDRRAFARCMEGEAAEQISADLALGRQIGVNSTPTIFFGIVLSDGTISLKKRVRGAVRFEDLKSAIEDLVRRPQEDRGVAP